MGDARLGAGKNSNADRANPSDGGEYMARPGTAQLPSDGLRAFGVGVLLAALPRFTHPCMFS
jgi:hypothetical protein